LIAHGYEARNIAVLTFRGINNSAIAGSNGPPMLAGIRVRRPAGYDPDGKALWTSGDLHVDTLFRFKGQAADAVVVSFAEYNGSYTAGFKNLFDWASRHTLKMFEAKPTVLLSAAPGPRGGLTVLQSAVERLPRHGAEVVGSMALPRFKETFHPKHGLTDETLRAELDALLAQFAAAVAAPRQA